jgi:hypothetical protein
VGAGAGCSALQRRRLAIARCLQLARRVPQPSPPRAPPTAAGPSSAHLVDRGQRHHGLEVAAAVVKAGVDVAAEQRRQQGPVLGGLWGGGVGGAGARRREEMGEGQGKWWPTTAAWRHPVNLQARCCRRSLASLQSCSPAPPHPTLPHRPTSRRSIHESTTGFQPTSSALTKITPPRDTWRGRAARSRRVRVKDARGGAAGRGACWAAPAASRGAGVTPPRVQPPSPFPQPPPPPPPAAHRRRAAVVHVVDLQQQPHRWRQRDALVRRQGQHLVVVHHRVHGLDPLCGWGGGWGGCGRRR